MYQNRRKHKLLRFLAVQYELAISNVSDELGVEFQSIQLKLKCDEIQLLLLFTNLQLEEEVEKHYIEDIDRIYLTNKGHSSYINKKYILENNRRIFDTAKNWVQTIVPVLSLIITGIVVYHNNKTLDAKNLQFDKFSKKLDSIVIEQKKLTPTKK